MQRGAMNLACGAAVLGFALSVGLGTVRLLPPECLAVRSLVVACAFGALAFVGHGYVQMLWRWSNETRRSSAPEQIDSDSGPADR